MCDRVRRVLDRAHHRIYGTNECVALLDTAGFDVQAVEHYKLNWLWGLMTVNAVVRAH